MRRHYSAGQIQWQTVRDLVSVRRDIFDTKQNLIKITETLGREFLPVDSDISREEAFVHQQPAICTCWVI